MLNLSRASHNVLAKPRATSATRQQLPAQSPPPIDLTCTLGTTIPTLPNGKGLPSIMLSSTLPRQSSPRIMTPAEVPLSDEPLS